MRFVMMLLTLLVTGLSMSSRDAAASPDGKRVALLGTSNANPYIGAWTSTGIDQIFTGNRMSASRSMTAR